MAEIEEVGKRKLLGPELIQISPENVKLIRAKLKTTHDGQKTTQIDTRDLEFTVRDKVFLNLPSWKCVLKFGKRESTIYWSYERLLIKLV